MSKRERRDADRGRDGDRGRDDRGRDRRDSQPDEEQQRRGDDLQEGDSLTALKAILAKVAGLLNPLQLTQEESIKLVEQLYGSVLAMDVLLAGEPDDTRKSLILGHIQSTTITREGGKITVEYPKERPQEPAPAAASPAEPAPAPPSSPAPPLTEAAGADGDQATAGDQQMTAGRPAPEPSGPETETGEKPEATPKSLTSRQSGRRRAARQPSQPAAPPTEQAEVSPDEARPSEPAPPEAGPEGD